jgi:hypothetical protein
MAVKLASFLIRYAFCFLLRGFAKPKSAPWIYIPFGLVGSAGIGYQPPPTPASNTTFTPSPCLRPSPIPTLRGLGVSISGEVVLGNALLRGVFFILHGYAKPNAASWTFIPLGHVWCWDGSTTIPTPTPTFRDGLLMVFENPPSILCSSKYRGFLKHPSCSKNHNVKMLEHIHTSITHYIHTCIPNSTHTQSQAQSQSQSQSHTQTHTRTHSNTNTITITITQTQTQTQTQTHTQSQSQSQTHKHTNTHTHNHNHTHNHTITHNHSHTQSETITHTHNHNHNHTNTHTHTHTQSQSQSHKHTHNHTHNHTIINNHTYSQSQ